MTGSGSGIPAPRSMLHKPQTIVFSKHLLFIIAAVAAALVPAAAAAQQ